MPLDVLHKLMYTQYHHFLTANGPDIYLGQLMHVFFGGTDGAWSRVRPALSVVLPLYCGVRGVTTMDDVKRFTPSAEWVERGSH